MIPASHTIGSYRYHVMSDRTKNGPTKKRPRKNSSHNHDMDRREFNGRVKQWSQIVFSNLPEVLEVEDE